MLPHFKTGKMTAYTISQLLKYKGKHEIDIYVVDNNVGDGSVEYIKPFFNDGVKYFEYPKGKLQSHGIGIDYLLPLIKTEWFITIESDAFPTQDNWLDYYEKLINEGYDCAGSLMQLSGGVYLHGAGALYNKSVWEESKEYTKNIQYQYLPNFQSKEGFDCHVMIHNSVFDKVISNPSDYVDLANGYKGLTKEQIIKRRDDYLPTVCPFHNGMGMLDESVKSYGKRNTESESPNILLNNRNKIINRIGYEPSQWFYYFHVATNKKVYFIPTEVKWLPNREGQQQEYTLMGNGFKHYWGISAYHGVENKDTEDIAIVKQSIPEQLYQSIPEKYKI